MKKVEDLNEKREINVSVDRVKYALIKYQSTKGLVSELAFYFGIMVTIIVTLCTATFNSILGIPADVIKGIFIAVLVILCVVSLVRTLLFVFNKQKIKNEQEFIDELEYKKKIKTIEDSNKKYRLITSMLMLLMTILIFGAFIGFGFLFKWATVYCIVAGIIFLMGILMWFSMWEDNFECIYNKLNKNKEQDNGQVKDGK